MSCVVVLPLSSPVGLHGLGGGHTARLRWQCRQLALGLRRPQGCRGKAPWRRFGSGAKAQHTPLPHPQAEQGWHEEHEGQSRHEVRAGRECTGASSGAAGTPQGECAAPGPWSAPHFLVRPLVAAGVAAAVVLGVGPGDLALGADPLKTCSCLLQQCRGELLRCLGDVNCAANIACLQACNGRADETECQIGCGDLFANSVVDRFNACAISEHPCVPRKPDDNQYPVPADAALVPQLDVQRLRGPWYISAGLNPTFDTFDCQLHTFEPTGPRSFEAQLTWRIRTPDGGYFTRSAVQDFVQDAAKPALLLNHDNEFLHYQDDWYVLSSKLDGGGDDYFLVYYKGSNDAWDGYGGAVLYTRSKTVPEGILPEVRRASTAVGLDFDRFIQTDNTCGPQQPLLARLEQTVEERLEKVEKAVEEGVVKVEKAVEEEVVFVENKVLEAGKEELQLLQQLGKGLLELKKDKDQFLAQLTREEAELVKRMEAMEMGGADDLEDLFGNSLPLRRVR